MLKDTDSTPFIARFCQDPEKYAFQVQLHFLPTRYNQQRQLASRISSPWPSPTTYSPRIASSPAPTRPHELVLYRSVYRLLDGQLARPDLVVYIWDRVEVLAVRLRKRNRTLEFIHFHV